MDGNIPNLKIRKGVSEHKAGEEHEQVWKHDISSVIVPPDLAHLPTDEKTTTGKD